MTALLDYACQTEVPITPVLALADGMAPGLEAAESRGISALSLPREDYTSKADHEAAVISAVEDSGAEMIALAGYMRLLSADFCRRFEDRIINIHPSLLPRHKGLDTHRRAIESGDEQHGCSVHLVTAGMDEGPVIAQRAVPVMDDDTPEVLAARVLAEEHQLYPLVLGALACGRIIIKNGKIIPQPGSIKGMIAGQNNLVWPPT
jgi:phosphoribosylglycinamide formyltransferase-1